jgi:hypothetical protein
VNRWDNRTTDMSDLLWNFHGFCFFFLLTEWYWSCSLAA